MPPTRPAPPSGGAAGAAAADSDPDTSDEIPDTRFLLPDADAADFSRSPDKKNSRDENDDDDVHDDAPSSEKKPKRGVVYISTLAPGMNPGVVRKLLSAHATIHRLYLEPEDPSKRKRRIANGGHTAERFVEGWVEFESRKDAKRVARVVDGSRVGPRKASRFYEDIWRIKYLPGFTWDHLTEKTEFERRQRAQRLKLELARAKKDDEAFLQRLEKSKQVKGMEERRGVNEAKRVKRSFAQLAPIVKD